MNAFWQELALASSEDTAAPPPPPPRIDYRDRHRKSIRAAAQRGGRNRCASDGFFWPAGRRAHRCPPTRCGRTCCIRRPRGDVERCIAVGGSFFAGATAMIVGMRIPNDVASRVESRAGSGFSSIPSSLLGMRVRSAGGMQQAECDVTVDFALGNAAWRKKDVVYPS